MQPTQNQTVEEKGGVDLGLPKSANSCSGPYGLVCGKVPICRTLRAAPPTPLRQDLDLAGASQKRNSLCIYVFIYNYNFLIYLSSN